jgi:Zn-dependent protease
MLSWSVNLFRIRGIQLALHGSFLLLLGYVAWEGWREQGGAGLVWSVATLVAFFACVVLHELGHSFMALRYGIGVRRILLMPIGGMAEFDRIPRQPAREFLMTLAGPAVNFALAGPLWLVVRTFGNEVLLYSAEGLLYQLFVANLVMGCFNLLPAFPMDGGRILRALLATRLPYLRATFWAARVGKVIAALGLVAALAAPELHVADRRLWLVAVLFGFIAMAGETEYRATLRRELEDAHWRATLARIYGRSPPEDQPPVLPP